MFSKILIHVDTFSTVNKNGRSDVSEPSLKVLSALFKTDFTEMGTIHSFTQNHGRGIETFTTEPHITSYSDVSYSDILFSQSEYFLNLYSTILDSQQDINFNNLSITIYDTDNVFPPKHITLDKDHKTVVIGNKGFSCSYMDIETFIIDDSEEVKNG